MKAKAIVKMAVDVLMTLILLFLMGYQFWGDVAHEWAGAGMFVLFLAHHALNGNWYKALFRGKYTSARIFMLLINMLLLLVMTGLMVSGIILSRDVFAFLPISGGIALARPLHVFSSFWGFVLMALHLGLHWNMILAMVRRAAGPVTSKLAQALLRAGACAVAAYGLYAFIRNRFLSYLFLTSSFVFFDFERPLILFFTEYAAIMGLFVFIAHVGTKALGKRKVRVE